MKVLDVYWNTAGFGCFGIAKVQNSKGDIEYRAASVSGKDEDTDAQTIADYGSLFPKKAGDALFKTFGN